MTDQYVSAFSQSPLRQSNSVVLPSFLVYNSHILRRNLARKVRGQLITGS